MPDRIREINERFIQKVGIETSGNAYSKGQIIVLDNKKEPYDIGIYRADKYLLDRTEELNDSINDVRDAYQDRVDDNCRTDLFWRIVGITTTERTETTPGQGGQGGNAGTATTYTDTTYTIYCEQLNSAGYIPQGVRWPPSIPDQENPPPALYDPNYLYLVDQDSQTLQLGGYEKLPLDTKVGLTPTQGENYHGWKLRDEPYSEDLLDPVLATGIGTIPFADNLLTFETLQPIDQVEPAITGIKTGGIINCDSNGIWFDNATFIVSYGTTVVGLGTTTVAGVTTSAGEARKTYVRTNDFAMRAVNVPEINGTFSNFFILKGPQDINYDKLALKRTGELADELSPYNPQRVCPMTRSLVGTGVRIDYTNTGYPTSCKDWNKFLEGYPDPADPVEIKDDADYEFKIVEDPKVGAGRIWYNDAFTVFPILQDGSYAKRGDVRTVRVDTTQPQPPVGPPLIVTQNVYTTAYPNGTCPNLDDNIEDKEEIRDELEDTFRDDLVGVSSVSKLYELTNALREERNEINLRIWAFRLQMGEGETKVDAWDERLKIINSPDFYDILQTPLSSPDEIEKFTKRSFPTQ